MYLNMIFKTYYVCADVCACVNVCAYVQDGSARSERGIRPPDARVTSWPGYWEPILGPLEEQPTLLIEPTLHPLI